MNRVDLERYCKDNGVPCESGERLRVMDLSRLPDVLRDQFDSSGFLNAESVPPAAISGSEPSKPLRGELPEDFPGHTALEAEGLTTYAKVRKRLDSLTEIQGIGEATAEKIRAAVNESSENEEEQETE